MSRINYGSESKLLSDQVDGGLGGGVYRSIGECVDGRSLEVDEEEEEEEEDDEETCSETGSGESSCSEETEDLLNGADQLAALTRAPSLPVGVSGPMMPSVTSSATLSSNGDAGGGAYEPAGRDVYEFSSEMDSNPPTVLPAVLAGTAVPPQNMGCKTPSSYNGPGSNLAPPTVKSSAASLEADLSLEDMDASVGLSDGQIDGIINHLDAQDRQFSFLNGPLSEHALAAVNHRKRRRSSSGVGCLGAGLAGAAEEAAQSGGPPAAKMTPSSLPQRSTPLSAGACGLIDDGPSSVGLSASGVECRTQVSAKCEGCMLLDVSW